MSHRPIHRFEQTGLISDDKYIPSIKTTMVLLVADQMRAHGYVPRIDIDVDWSTKYVNGNYEFKLSVYGVYVGRAKSHRIKALYGNHPILFIEKARSNGYSKKSGFVQSE